MSGISAIRRHIRALGWLDGTLLLLKRGLRRLTGGRAGLIKYRLVAQPVPEQPWLPSGRGRRIEVRASGPEDPALARFPRPAEVFRFRFEQGAHCFVAYRDAEPIGFIWFTVGDYEEDEVRCLFRPRPEGRAAWDFDVYVAPEHRIGPAFLRLWDTANAYLRERGVRWSLSRIDAFNPGSVGAHRRLGAASVGWLVFLTAGPLRLMLGSVRPWCHLGLSRAHRPVVTLDTAALPIPAANPARLAVSSR